MKRLDWFHAEYFPPAPNGVRYSDIVVHRFGDDSLVAAIFSGPWFELASRAFSTTLVDNSSAESATHAFRTARATIDDHWNALSEEEQWYQGWSGTACGIMVAIQADTCSCYWLGDVQAHHLRGDSVIGTTSPHTIYQAQKEHGLQNIDEKLRYLKTRWLSEKHICDHVNWSLLDGDVILVCSSFVHELLVPANPDTRAPLMLAEFLVKEAGVQVRRLSHDVLAMRMTIDEES